MHRAPYIDGRVAITGKVDGPKQARGHTRCKHFPVPGAVILLGNGSGLLAAQDAAQALLHRLKREPVAPRSESIALLAVLFVCIKVPPEVSSAHQGDSASFSYGLAMKFALPSGYRAERLLGFRAALQLGYCVERRLSLRR